MHRLALEAERDLDDIWLHVARESSSIEITNILIDTITDRLSALSTFPRIGRSRHDDFGPGYRSLVVGEYVIVYSLKRTKMCSSSVCCMDDATWKASSAIDPPCQHRPPTVRRYRRFTRHS